MLDEVITKSKIRAYRIKAGYKTQKDVAKVLNVSVPTYIRYETKPFSLPIKNFFTLAKLFGCEANDFFKD